MLGKLLLAECQRAKFRAPAARDVARSTRQHATGAKRTIIHPDLLGDFVGNPRSALDDLLLGVQRRGGPILLGPILPSDSTAFRDQTPYDRVDGGKERRP